MVNSTIGWSSLHHGTPVLALDETIYGYMGLNSPGTLDEFWSKQPEVDRDRVTAAENWLKQHSQANGSTWVRLPNAGPSGLDLAAKFQDVDVRAHKRRRKTPTRSLTNPIQAEAPR